MKKSLSFVILFVLLACSATSHAAATFDATGTWAINFNITAIDPSGTPQDSWSNSMNLIMAQIGENPNDEFTLATHVGHVFDDYYVVEGPTSGLPASVPQDSRPWSFIPDAHNGSGRYYHWVYDYHHFTVEGSGDILSGDYRCTATGWYVTQPGPSQLYFEPNIVDLVLESTFTGTKVVPFPGCVSAKLKAASTLCKSLAKCCSKDIENPDENKLIACEDKSYEKFETSWIKAEDKATKKGLNCDTDDASGFISSIYDGGIYLIHQEIEANVPDTKDGAKLAASLLKAVGTYCSSIFKAESANTKKADTGKLGGALYKAEVKFLNSWNKAIVKADKKGAIYNGDIGTVTAIIEGMEDEVFDGLQ